MSNQMAEIRRELATIKNMIADLTEAWNESVKTMERQTSPEEMDAMLVRGMEITRQRSVETGTLAVIRGENKEGRA